MNPDFWFAILCWVILVGGPILFFRWLDKKQAKKEKAYEVAFEKPAPREVGVLLTPRIQPVFKRNVTSPTENATKRRMRMGSTTYPPVATKRSNFSRWSPPPATPDTGSDSISPLLAGVIGYELGKSSSDSSERGYSGGGGSFDGGGSSSSWDSSSSSSSSDSSSSSFSSDSGSCSVDSSSSD